MGAITQGIFDRLSADAVLVGLLGTFQSAPSILTSRPAPPGFDIKAHAPYVVSTGQLTDQGGPADTKNKGGREITRDVYAYDALTNDPATIEAVAERIRSLFHRQASLLSIAGYAVAVAEAFGPIEADEDDARGRIVTVRLVLEEN